MAKIVPGIQNTTLQEYDAFDDWKSTIKFLSELGSNYQKHRVNYESNSIQGMDMLSGLLSSASTDKEMENVRGMYNNIVSSTYESDNPAYNIRRQKLDFDISEKDANHAKFKSLSFKLGGMMYSTNNRFGNIVTDLEGNQLKKYYDDLVRKEYDAMEIPEGLARVELDEYKRKAKGLAADGWMARMGKERIELSKWVDLLQKTYSGKSPSFMIGLEVDGVKKDISIKELTASMAKYDEIMKTLILEGVDDKWLSQQEAQYLATLTGEDGNGFNRFLKVKSDHLAGYDGLVTQSNNMQKTVLDKVLAIMKANKGSSMTDLISQNPDLAGLMQGVVGHESFDKFANSDMVTGLPDDATIEQKYQALMQDISNYASGDGTTGMDRAAFMTLLSQMGTEVANNKTMGEQGRYAWGASYKTEFILEESLELGEDYDFSSIAQKTDSDDKTTYEESPYEEGEKRVEDSIDPSILSPEEEEIRTKREADALEESKKRTSESLLKTYPPNQAALDSVSVRNNNPGNIKSVDTGEFRQFNTIQEGWEALYGQIELDAEREDTLESFIFGQKEDGSDAYTQTDQAAYLKNLQTWLKKSKDTKLSDIDPQELVQAIARQEGYLSADGTAPAPGELAVIDTSEEFTEETQEGLEETQEYAVVNNIVSTLKKDNPTITKKESTTAKIEYNGLINSAEISKEIDKDEDWTIEDVAWTAPVAVVGTAAAVKYKIPEKVYDATVTLKKGVQTIAKDIHATTGIKHTDITEFLEGRNTRTAFRKFEKYNDEIGRAKRHYEKIKDSVGRHIDLTGTGGHPTKITQETVDLAKETLDELSTKRTDYFNKNVSYWAKKWGVSKDKVSRMFGRYIKNGTITGWHDWKRAFYNKFPNAIKTRIDAGGFGGLKPMGKVGRVGFTYSTGYDVAAALGAESEYMRHIGATTTAAGFELIRQVVKRASVMAETPAGRKKIVNLLGKRMGNELIKKSKSHMAKLILQGKLGKNAPGWSKVAVAGTSTALNYYFIYDLLATSATVANDFLIQSEEFGKKLEDLPLRITQ